MYTLEQYNALTAAIAQGALRVKYSDKEVEYRSLDDMLTLKRIMEQQLGIGEFAATSQGSRRVGVYFKGA